MGYMELNDEQICDVCHQLSEDLNVTITTCWDCYLGKGRNAKMKIEENVLEKIRQMQGFGTKKDIIQETIAECEKLKVMELLKEHKDCSSPIHVLYTKTIKECRKGTLREIDKFEYPVQTIFNPRTGEKDEELKQMINDAIQNYKENLKQKLEEELK